MGIFELLLTAVALSMDAFAVAMCKGLSVRCMKKKHMLIVGLYFGAFQALMPLIGFFLGSAFSSYVEKFSAWIAFILLAIIGGNMIKEALSKDEEKMDDCFGFKNMLALAVATSIDALVAGVAFAMEFATKKPFGGIWLTVSMIGVITFILSAIGVKIGNIFGAKYKSKAELCGGIVLIGIGLKAVLDHLFFK